MIFVAGLAIIIVGWIAQLYETLTKEDKHLSPAFLLLYAIGCALLCGGNFSENDVTIGVLNTILVILAAILLATLIIQKRSV